MDTLFDDLNIPVEKNASLAVQTWYGVGGSARFLARPSSTQQLAALAQRAHENKLPWHVLGSGANLVVADKCIDALVISLSDPAFKQVSFEGNHVRCGAGRDLAKLVLETAKAGLGGIECLAGIPASVGGAVRMNAGGAFGEIGKSVFRVTVMDVSGQVYYRDRDDLQFSYRKTNIVARAILEVEFELTPQDPDELMKRVKEIFLYKKTSQPLAAHSAGCAFKNPPHEVGATAGQLIDRTGLKGLRVGGASVSEHHANFIITDKTAQAQDIITLMEQIEEKVLATHGVKLEREVVVWQ